MLRIETIAGVDFDQVLLLIIGGLVTLALGVLSWVAKKVVEMISVLNKADASASRAHERITEAYNARKELETEVKAIRSKVDRIEGALDND